MKTLTSLSLIGALLLTSCDSASDEYRRLLRETGATPQELNRGISIYTDFYREMQKEIDAGTFSVEDMMEASKQAKEVMATIQRDDEMAAAFALKTLKLMEERGEDAAKEFVVGRLEVFMKAEFPSTENSQIIRGRILEYSKQSSALSIHEE